MVVQSPAELAPVGKDKTPPVPPTIRLNGKAYIIDLSLRQFRETMNPGHRVDFDSVAGVELCRQAGVITCLRCGASAIVAGSAREEAIWCLRCRSPIGPHFFL